MAELKDLLAGCTATDPAGIQVHIEAQKQGYIWTTATLKTVIHRQIQLLQTIINLYIQ